MPSKLIDANADFIRHKLPYRLLTLQAVHEEEEKEGLSTKMDRRVLKKYATITLVTNNIQKN